MGTPLFMAPEVRAGGVLYDEKVDVYSAGKVLVHLFKGVKFLHYLYEANLPALEVGERMEGWTKEGQIFLARMLAEDPAERPTLAELERDWAPALEGAVVPLGVAQGEANMEGEGRASSEMELKPAEADLIEATKAWVLVPWRVQWEEMLVELVAERVRSRPRRVALWELVQEEAEQMREEAEEEGAWDAARATFLEQRKGRLARGV